MDAGFISVGHGGLLSLRRRAAVAQMFHLSGEKVNWIRNEGNLETGGKLSLSEAGKMDERGRRCESGSERLPCKIRQESAVGGATAPPITCHRVAAALEKKEEENLIICSEESLALVWLHCNLFFPPLHIQTNSLLVCVKVLYSRRGP